jgi:hypothetical protein
VDPGRGEVTTRPARIRATFNHRRITMAISEDATDVELEAAKLLIGKLGRVKGQRPGEYDFSRRRFTVERAYRLDRLWLTLDLVGVDGQTRASVRCERFELLQE